MLAMPSRRFWSMERQITRIKAEGDLRLINVNQAHGNKEALDRASERLILELGETTQVKRQLIVKGESGRKAKFAKVMR